MSLAVYRGCGSDEVVFRSSDLGSSPSRGSSPASAEIVKLKRTYKVTILPGARGGVSAGGGIGNFAFTPAGQLAYVRKTENGGELVTCDVRSGAASRLPIPQPKNASNRFAEATLDANSHGDVLVVWEIEGNGDHGIAVLEKGATSFRVCRFQKCALSFPAPAIRSSKRKWYLFVVGAPRLGESTIQVWTVSRELDIARLGKPGALGYPIGVDAAFVSEDECVVTRQAKGPQKRDLQIDATTFDARAGEWSSEQTLFSQSRIEGADAEVYTDVVVGESGVASYLWWFYSPPEYLPASVRGIYYGSVKPKVARKLPRPDYGAAAVAVKDDIALFYGVEKTPGRVFSLVISNGALGPEGYLTVNARRPLFPKRDLLVRALADGSIWLFDARDRKVVYELELCPASG